MKIFIQRIFQNFSFSNDDQLILSKHKTNQIDFGNNVNVTGNRAIVVKAYEEALALAMQDLARTFTATIDSKLWVMIVGPGCSELLPIVLTTSKNISQKLNIFVFDEDEWALHAMSRGIEYYCPNEGTATANNQRLDRISNPPLSAISTDIKLVSSRKRPELNGKMHIIVSMPFESMYHSQWLQFNFDQVKHFLHADGLIIPQQSQLSIAPVMSSKIHNKVRHGEILVDSKEVDVLEYVKRSQTIFKVFPRNFYECAAPQLIFSFDHRPDKRIPFCHTTETELIRVMFNTKLECMVDGFFGYFQATLYRHIEVCNRKMDQMNDTVCPALTFYPLASPLYLRAMETLQVIFRLCFDDKEDCVWFEWGTIEPNISMVHNFKGWSHRMAFKRNGQIDSDS